MQSIYTVLEVPFEGIKPSQVPRAWAPLGSFKSPGPNGFPRPSECSK